MAVSTRAVDTFGLTFSGSFAGRVVRQLPHGYREIISRGEVVLRSDPKLDFTGSSDNCLTAIEKTHLVEKCPESKQLPHGYRENTSRGEVVLFLRANNFLTGIEKTHLVGKLS